METKYWTKIKEFHGVQLLRDPETMQCRIVPIERPQPQQKPEPVISPEMERKAAVAYERYMASQQATYSPAMTPQPKPETPEEKWRVNPALRAEFGNNLGAYLAYCKAAEAGRVRICGR